MSYIGKVSSSLRLYGGAGEFWDCTEHEIMLAGGYETGKTIAALYKLHALLSKHPNSQALMVRKTYKSIKSSAVVTYEKKVLTVPPDHPKSPISCYGGESPEHYSYPNGSRLHVGGMDNADKFLSAEFDFIYVNQAEEIGLDDWEKLLGRATGRAGNAPYAQIMGDCNPGPPTHWIKQRGSIHVFQSRHEDNPTLFDHEAGVWTEQGLRTLAILDSLTGTRYKRGRLGLWVQAEGAVYELFDTSVHVLSWQELENLGILLPNTKTLDRKKARRVIAGVDWGFTNPGVIQVWAVDGDGRMYLVHEVYQTKKLIGWWVDEAKKLRDEYHVELFVCDPAEPSNIQEFRNAGLFALEANNDITAGIQKVATRLKIAGDGQARLYVARGALREADPILLNAKKPTCLLDEMPAYEWPTGADGKPVKEIPVGREQPRRGRVPLCCSLRRWHDSPDTPQAEDARGDRMTIANGIRTPDNYTDVMIYNPDGTARRSEVLKGREMTVTAAIDGLESGQQVWVTLGDAPEFEMRWAVTR